MDQVRVLKDVAGQLDVRDVAGIEEAASVLLTRGDQAPSSVAEHHLQQFAAVPAYQVPLEERVAALVGEWAFHHEHKGMRAMFTRGSMNRSQRDGGLPPDNVVQDEDTILADSDRLINRFHETGEGAMIQIALAPCSPFSVTTSLMR